MSGTLALINQQDKREQVGENGRVKSAGEPERAMGRAAPIAGPKCHATNTEQHNQWQYQHHDGTARCGRQCKMGADRQHDLLKRVLQHGEANTDFRTGTRKSAAIDVGRGEEALTGDICNSRDQPDENNQIRSHI
jgi:hypothetical protein